MEVPKSSLNFLGYKVRSIDFHVNEDFVEDQDTFNIEPELTIEVQREDEIGVVLLSCSVFDDETEYPFTLHIAMEGGFQLNNIPQEKTDDVLSRNAVAIMYPYLRAAVTSITQTAGINPLILPIANVSILADELFEKTQEKKDQLND